MSKPKKSPKTKAPPPRIAAKARTGKPLKHGTTPSRSSKRTAPPPPHHPIASDFIDALYKK